MIDCIAGYHLNPWTCGIAKFNTILARRLELPVVRIGAPELSSYRRPLLGTGLCGGLTTFSTMQVEIIKMLEHHHYGLAVGYTAASIVAGLLAVYLATALVRRVRIRG